MKNLNVFLKCNLLFVLISLYGCSCQRNLSYISYKSGKKKIKLTENEYKNWQHKDIQLDTIPGISLDRAYSEILRGKKGKEVVVAVIDTKLDIHHDELKDNIWTNKKEIPSNGIDDDKNGYIDDINGWNFLGTLQGKDILYQNSEITRIVRAYKDKYENKDKNGLSEKQLEEYKMYKRVRGIYYSEAKKAKANMKYFDSISIVYVKAKQELKERFNKEKYMPDELDSIQKLNPELEGMIKVLKYAQRNNFTEDKFKRYYKYYKNLITYGYNVSYNEREGLNENSEDIEDSIYGNNIVFGDVPFQHSTSVSGLLAASRANNLEVKGVSDNIKILPVVMVATGDEYDKDVALAIRYAVDNGAKIINMSWGKRFSLHSDWVIDAVKYAKENDVLLIHGAGNEATNTDEEDFYPIDNVAGKEFVDNFIVVGASSYSLDKNLIARFSNYGKENVDVFAPGNYLYTTDVNNKFKYNSGTSLATPLVSGVAGLIFSYYPDLTSAEVKNIILNSGVEYSIMVKVPREKGKEMPFNQMSKSGKIINAFNALKLAGEVSKKKRH
ncbi:S8 family serine peptidase [Tenacibaculum xiamenense]|uniref:S8 family serine peptidase n=1 Tax=Tenacibaculum xiamenense TaxID=1261553 RepID=UPI0038955EBD